MLEKLVAVEARYNELNELMASPEVMSDAKVLIKYGQEQASLEDLVQASRRYRDVSTQIDEVKEMMAEEDDEEMRLMVKEELSSLQEEQKTLEDTLQVMLLPKDPNDDKSVIMEIRAGAGGNEAGLFAADLFRMYSMYSQSHNWKVSVLSQNESGIGGFKEIVFDVHGVGAYSKLKYESGVHRVQRVPQTESSGRIHTSTATVAVLPEMDEVEIEIDLNDVRIDIFRSSGPGGQSVNTTDSAVRLTHEPTGLVISCQDEKSQLQNKTKAFNILRAKLYELEQQRIESEHGATRRSQVGSGDRSEKIRTYNFPQTRVTDHRIHHTSHRLEGMMNGNIDDFIDALKKADIEEKLKNLS
ncbi:peptide chain release factor 1 [Anaerolineales bacterium HSG24]|nr:peptide chain release factor 1 [Anaerolineales bacterium HSG24]